MLVCRFWPITENLALQLCRWEGELEGCVKIMLLLLASMNHLAVPEDQEPGVSNVCGVKLEVRM